MAPEAFIQQAEPGWLRLSIPAMRGDAGYFSELENRLVASPDILYLESVPALGCLMVDHAADANAILRYAEQHGLFHLADPDPPTGLRNRRPQQSGGQDPTKAPGPKPWMHAGTAAFAAISLYTASQGNYVGSAAENFWNAYQAHTKDLDAWTVILAAAGVYAIFQGNIVAPTLTALFYAVSAAQVARGETNEPAG